MQFRGDFTNLADEFGRKLADYPLFTEQHQKVFSMGPDGPISDHGEKVYQWSSVDRNWNVILGRKFLSFYCLTYVSFADFSPRFESVLERLVETVEIPIFERIGLRYVNQVADESFVSNLSHYIEPLVLGFAGLSAKSTEVELLGSQNQVAYKIGNSVMQVRSGILDAGQTVDPAIEPYNEKSWILDLDASSTVNMTTGIGALLEEAGRLAHINYDFFKLVASDGFLNEFGGES